ncbi:MAG: hypothetical protein M3P48_01015 [Actinomycetota bacterium]|nr:hypothetical protein [Actinomycetota bacterium]
MELLLNLIPPVVMTIIFVALLVTAFRATDGARSDEHEERARRDDPKT